MCVNMIQTEESNGAVVVTYINQKEKWCETEVNAVMLKREALLKSHKLFECWHNQGDYYLKCR